MMTIEIKMNSIGIIHTPYKGHDEIPIQGRFKPEQEGVVELDRNLALGLKDLNGFSHAILIYHLHDKRLLRLIIMIRSKG